MFRTIINGILQSADLGIVPVGSIGTTEIGDDAVTNAKLANDKILSVQGAASFVYNTVAKTTLYSFTLPAGALANVGDMVEIECLFMIDNQSGSTQTLTAGIDLDDTNMVTATSGTGTTGNLSNATNISVARFYATIQKTATDAQRCVAHFDIGGRSLSYDLHGVAVEDDGVSQTIAIHITMGANNANFGIKAESLIARLLKA